MNARGGVRPKKRKYWQLDSLLRRLTGQALPRWIGVGREKLIINSDQMLYIYVTVNVMDFIRLWCCNSWYLVFFCMNSLPFISYQNLENVISVRNCFHRFVLFLNNYLLLTAFLLGGGVPDLSIYVQPDTSVTRFRPAPIDNN